MRPASTPAATVPCVAPFTGTARLRALAGATAATTSTRGAATPTFADGGALGEVHALAAVGDPGAPEGMAVDATTGAFYVGTDNGTARGSVGQSKVLAYSAAGTLTREYTITGQRSGQANGVTGLALDGAGGLYALDASTASCASSCRVGSRRTSPASRTCPCVPRPTRPARASCRPRTPRRCPRRPPSTPPATCSWPTPRRASSGRCRGRAPSPCGTSRSTSSAPPARARPALHSTARANWSSPCRVARRPHRRGLRRPCRHRRRGRQPHPPVAVQPG